LEPHPAHPARWQSLARADGGDALPARLGAGIDGGATGPATLGGAPHEANARSNVARKRATGHNRRRLITQCRVGHLNT